MRESEGLPDGGVSGRERWRGLLVRLDRPRSGGDGAVVARVSGPVGTAQSDSGHRARAVNTVYTMYTVYTGCCLLNVVQETPPAPLGPWAVPRPEADDGAAVTAAVAGGAVQSVAVVGAGRAHGAVGGVVRVTGVPATVD